MTIKKKSDLFLSTGLHDFERLFGGGGIHVDPDVGTSLLVEGDAGIGKTTLALQLAASAITGHGAVCLYYCFDQSPMEIEHLLHSFSWGSGVQVSPAEWSHVADLDLARSSGNNGALVLINSPPAKHELQVVTDRIREDARAIKQGLEGRLLLSVLDSVGAVADLIKLERTHVRYLLERMREIQATPILIRERYRLDDVAVAEYITTVVLDLRMQHPMGGEIVGASAPRSILEIKKTRNQQSHRGPHEFQIQAKRGFVVYPSLFSAAPPLDDAEVPGATDRVKFGIDLLDEALSESLDASGLPAGHSILLVGPPGNRKTELGIKLLSEGIQETDRALFISCRIDHEALKRVSISGDEAHAFFDRNLIFIDARYPYKTPSMVFSEIRGKVEEAKANGRIQRAILFGVGMLETLPMFQRNPLPFLQVLLSFLHREGITLLLIDWPRDDPARPTAITGDLVSAKLEVGKKLGDDGRESENPILELHRRDYRAVRKVVGEVRLDRNGVVEIIPVNVENGQVGLGCAIAT